MAILDFRSGILWYLNHFVFSGNKRVSFFGNWFIGIFWFNHCPYCISNGCHLVHWKCLHYNVIIIWTIFRYCPGKKDLLQKSLSLHGVYWFIFHHYQYPTFLEFQMEKSWIESRCVLQKDFSICCPYVATCHPKIHCANTFLNFHQLLYCERGKKFISSLISWAKAFVSDLYCACLLRFKIVL